MLIILLWLKKLRPLLKLLNLDGVRITKYENMFGNGYTEICSKEILLILFWKLILGLIKLMI